MSFDVGVFLAAEPLVRGGIHVGVGFGEWLANLSNPKLGRGAAECFTRLTRQRRPSAFDVGGHPGAGADASHDVGVAASSTQLRHVKVAACLLVGVRAFSDQMPRRS